MRLLMLSLISISLFLSSCSNKKVDVQRLPNWSKCVEVARQSGWGKDLKDIPATVVDNGVLRFVPYLSYRAGDYELNVYGDPDRPCCIELGIYGKSLHNQESRANCLAFLESVLPEKNDRAVLNLLQLTKDTRESNGLTFEVTPETAEDAYGGWWISIYDEAATEKSRSTPAERKQITVAVQDIETSPSTPGADSPSWGASDLKYARQPAASASKPGSGSVYVRSYVKKDGTYVGGHTRSAPRK